MYPCAYLTGLDINFAKIIETVLRSIIHSAVVFVFPILAYRALEHNDNGSVFVFGTLVRASFHAEHLMRWDVLCVCVGLNAVHALGWNDMGRIFCRLHPGIYRLDLGHQCARKLHHRDVVRDRVCCSVGLRWDECECVDVYIHENNKKVSGSWRLD